ncbi:RHS repeat-associated core domain-containing protein [Nocardioides sp. InS609-2]|uniref:RHS repeat-associated core domain-containing protein n=1 Tax=Nocardioides sp. InS609-2 TaxID=2760705 RepID=UPI0020BE3DEE|nr:RHS repeat-associated core domain-containing protein [Nocardioides sp. InS609-2]
MAGQRYFTDSACNVFFDRDTATARVEDELDVTRESTVALVEVALARDASAPDDSGQPRPRDGGVLALSSDDERSGDCWDCHPFVQQSRRSRQILVGDVPDTATTRTYDAFDRTTRRTATVRANPAVSTRYVYLGTSDQVAFEEQQDTTQAWQLAKTYTYGPGGEQLAMRDTGVDVPGPDATESTIPDKQLDPGETRELFFGANPHGDIETLTNNAGEVVSSYRYTAYGSADQSGTLGLDAPDTETPDDGEPGDEPADAPQANVVNPYRFNAKRYDGATGSYDMGFRDYDPGLNRYTSRDMYNAPSPTSRWAWTPGTPTGTPSPAATPSQASSSTATTRSQPPMAVRHVTRNAKRACRTPPTETPPGTTAMRSSRRKATMRPLTAGWAARCPTTWVAAWQGPPICTRSTSHWRARDCVATGAKPCPLSATPSS